MLKAYKSLLSAALVMILVSPVSATDNGWLLISGSDKTDFKIICTEGQHIVWGVYPRGGISDYQVARNIYVGRTADGGTILSFLRGFINADKPTTYIPARNVSCEATEK